MSVLCPSGLGPYKKKDPLGIVTQDAKLFGKFLSGGFAHRQ